MLPCQKTKSSRFFLGPDIKIVVSVEVALEPYLDLSFLDVFDVSAVPCKLSNVRSDEPRDIAPHELDLPLVEGGLLYVIHFKFLTGMKGDVIQDMGRLPCRSKGKMYERN